MTKVQNFQPESTPRFFDAIAEVIGVATLVVAGFLTMLHFAAV
jgi:hypothetical protein